MEWQVKIAGNNCCDPKSEQSRLGHAVSVVMLCEETTEESENTTKSRSPRGPMEKEEYQW